MNITQTRFFKEDCDHYTKLALDYMYSSNREEIANSIKRLEHLRGRDYVKALAAKCNQRAKKKFYTV